MTKRKDCCKYCYHQEIIADAWGNKNHACSLIQDYVKPMFVCDDFESIKISDEEWEKYSDYESYCQIED